MFYTSIKTLKHRTENMFYSGCITCKYRMTAGFKQLYQATYRVPYIITVVRCNGVTSM